MATGLLQVEGKIDLTQFWPDGSSDADTSKILVDVSADSFKFQRSATEQAFVTHVFENSRVKGRQTRAPIDGSGRITVRLQGVDAPELHYRPDAAKKVADQTASQRSKYLELNEDYRQNFAETATVSLRAKLDLAGANPLACRVVAYVDEPNEVFDTYGRFVGDIVVHIGNEIVNINEWLVWAGWAFPGFYNSMSEEEINTFVLAADHAYAHDLGVWSQLSDYVGRLDWKLKYRRPKQNHRPAPDPAADSGPVISPKLFRRLAAWEVNRKSGMITGTFKSYVKSKKEYCFDTNDFIDQGTAAQVRTMDEFIDSDGFIAFWPEELVYQEAASKLVDADGNLITTW